MCYRIFLIVILTLSAGPGLAGEKRYRVEILVLSHLHHVAVPSEAEHLRDFSDSLDFLKAEDEEDEEEPQDVDADAELTIEILPNEDQPEEPWANVIAVGNMSDVMREAWRRLRLSAPFRPEQHLAWEQSANEPFPSLRIHDLEVVLIDDPYADLRETDAEEAEEEVEAEESEDQPVVFTDQANLLPGDSIAEPIEEPELPDPTLFYRIDGTVMLRRSRFLHLDLDLELRQAVFDEQPMIPAPSVSRDSESDEPELPLPSSFLIHELKQSRQVKSRRMEYFDSPVLGVLVWITPFEAEDDVEVLSD